MAPGHTVNEVHKFSPVTDDIIGALNVQHVALGSSHTAVVTGLQLSVYSYHVCLYAELNLCQ